MGVGNGRWGWGMKDRGGEWNMGVGNGGWGWEVDDRSGGGENMVTSTITDADCFISCLIKKS